MDTSSQGLRITRQALREAQHTAILKKASCYHRFPFPDGYFDAIVSVQVIHHASRNQIQACIREIERVLRPDGMVFVTVPSWNRVPAWKGKRRYFSLREDGAQSQWIGPRTYIPLEGIEKGIVHYLYLKDDLKKDFSGFRIRSFRKDRAGYFCLLGSKK